MIKKLYKYLTKHKWELGFLENNIDNLLNGEKPKVWWVQHDYKDRWFADPFILSVDNKKIELLVEEYYDPIERGRIARLIIDKNSHRIVKIIPILELDSHLSFPAIIRKNNKIFIYPENSSGEGLNLYEFDINNNCCNKIDNISDLPLTDAIIRTCNSEDFLFSTYLPTQNGNELTIYKKTVNGKYQEVQIIHFDENLARMAGDFFYVGDDLYRPAQESNFTYGHSISLQKVNFQNEKFSMSEVVRIDSPHPIHKLGFHTFNVYDDTIVVDVKGFRRPFWGKICYWVKGLFLK